MSDEELCHLSAQGDRDAFSQIVERYQSLLCSLAYSRCGNLALSEDLAQEAFLQAWQRIHTLQDPNRLRQWLSGILRNLTANSARITARRGGEPAPLDDLPEIEAITPSPLNIASKNEEEALLWSALEDLPDTYREPLILFYREEQSIAQVAEQLELSEQAVTQRLSRGRILLRDELATFVEGTLARTRPGAAFTTGVLAMLPLLPASSTSTAVAAGAGAKAAGVAGGLAGAGIGMLVSGGLSRLVQRAARSEEERRSRARHAAWATLWCFAMCGALLLGLAFAGRLYTATTARLWIGVMLWAAALVGGVSWIGARMQRESTRIRKETGTETEPEGELTRR